MQCISGGEFSHLCYVITFLNLREWMTNTLKIILISDLIYGIFCICRIHFQIQQHQQFWNKEKNLCIGCQVVSHHLKLLLKVFFFKPKPNLLEKSILYYIRLWYWLNSKIIDQRSTLLHKGKTECIYRSYFRGCFW